MKKVFLLVVVIAIIGCGLFLPRLDIAKEPALTDEDRILQLITKVYPVYSHGGKSVVGVESISRHENKWSIVTIKSLQPVEKFIPVRLIIQENNSDFRVVAGPETFFSESQMLSLNLPDSVILELRKS